MGLCFQAPVAVAPGAAASMASTESVEKGSFRGRTTECLKSSCTMPTVMKVAAMIGALILAAAALTFVPTVGDALSTAVGANAMSCAILGFAVGGAFTLSSAAYFARSAYQARQAAKELEPEAEPEAEAEAAGTL